jgi:hypothetical protein
MATRSSQGIVTKVTGGSSKLTSLDVTTSGSDQEYILGGVPGTAGGESLFKIQLFANNIPIDYRLEEAVDEDGPWEELESGTAASVMGNEVSYSASGVFYAGVLKLTISSPSAGSYSVKMLAK